MARSTILRRQEAERQRIEAYETTLPRVSAVARPAPNFETAMREGKRGFEGESGREQRDLIYGW